MKNKNTIYQSTSPFATTAEQSKVIMANPFMDSEFVKSTESALPLSLLANTIPNENDAMNCSPFMSMKSFNTCTFDFVSVFPNDYNYEQDLKLRKIKKYTMFNAYIPLHLEKTTSMINKNYKKKEKYSYNNYCGILFSCSKRKVRFNSKKYVQYAHALNY